MGIFSLRNILVLDITNGSNEWMGDSYIILYSSVVD